MQGIHTAFVPGTMRRKWQSWMRRKKMEKTIEMLAFLVNRLHSGGKHEKANTLTGHAQYLSEVFGVDQRVFSFYLNAVR